MTTQNDIEIPKTTILGGKPGSARFARDPSVADAAAGMVVLALSIIGLADVAPRTLAALSCMIVGIALAFEGGGVVRRYRLALTSRGRSESSEIRWAMLAQIAGGAVAFVLALLALAGVERLAFTSIATIVLGASLLLGTGAEMEMDTAASAAEPTSARRVIHEAVIAAGGARLLVALANVTLGVLALVGVETVTLLSAASLLLAISLLLGSVSVADRLPSDDSVRPTV